MTINEELEKLEDSLRRLKVEYKAYFNGGLPRPPRDTVFPVETAIKRFSSDQSEMNFGQRFHFNQLAQKYAVYNDLWRKRLRDLEEGRGRLELPVILEDLAQVVASDPETEPDKVNQLFAAWLKAKRQVGDAVPNVDVLDLSEIRRRRSSKAELRQSRVPDKGGRGTGETPGRARLRASRESSASLRKERRDARCVIQGPSPLTFANGRG